MPPEPLPPMRSLVRAILEERCDIDWRSYNEHVLRHAIDVGLGPALYRLSREGSANPWQAVLRTQDLVARVDSMTRLDALEAILATVPSPLSGKVMLLKGISLCQRLYAEPHLRMMGDIDLLVELPLRHSLEDVLHRLGYVQRSPQLPEFYIDHHHSMPFMHPASGIIVEVHTALFRQQSPLGSVGLFSADAILARRRAGQFRGFLVNHLDDETELAYLAAHWINERRCFGTAMIPILDLALRIRQLPEHFDWNWLFDSLADTAAAPHVRVAITYLHRRLGVSLPAEVLRRLGTLSDRPPATVDPWLHRLIDRHALAGQAFGVIWTKSQANVVWEALMEPRSGWINIGSVPWRMIFPPGQARRFAPGFQWQRLRSAAQRRRQKL